MVMTLSFDRVGPLAILGLGRGDRQPQLLANGSRQEPAHGMRHPASRLLKLLGARSARALQQIENLGGLAAVAGAGGFLRALGRFLSEGGLLPRLALLGATLRVRLAPLAFWVAFEASTAGASAVSSASAVEIIVFLLCWRGFRDHMNRSDRPQKQADSEGNRTLANGWR